MFPKKVAFHTLGCKLNFAETSTIARQLLQADYQKVSFNDFADIYIINTCSVTENADKECKTIVKRAKQKNPDSLVIVIGCYAQLKPQEIAEIQGVDIVLGAKEKFNVLHFINTISPQSKIHSCEIDETDFFVSSYSVGDRTRAFLKVQDGCDYKCTYCTIPLARGISRSDSVENIVLQANEIASQNIKEIVLTGVNIGDFGKGEFGNKKHEHTFLQLIEALDTIEGIERIRISSIEPNLLSNEVIQFVANSKKFVPHFHIPLQAGSDALLKKMKRRYLTNLYTERIQTIKNLIPDCCIGVDVIVGFPGETHELFLETYNYINNLNISYLHVFTYSERENTEAINLGEVVPISERKKRNKMLRMLSEKKRMQFYESQIGKEKNVLWEHENKNDLMFGYTENYVRVQTHFQPEKINQIEKIKLGNFTPEGILEAQFENVLT